MSPSGPFDLHPITSPATGARTSAQTMLDASEVMETSAGKLREEVGSFLDKVAS